MSTNKPQFLDIDGAKLNRDHILWVSPVMYMADHNKYGFIIQCIGGESLVFIEKDPTDVIKDPKADLEDFYEDLISQL